MIKVAFSSKSKLQLQRIVGYLENKFGKRTAGRALQEVKKFEKRVTRFPEIHPVFDKATQTRRAVLRGKMLVFYRVETYRVYVTAILTTYQDYTTDEIN